MCYVLIGELKKIEIEHDDSGIGSNWHLDRVEIKELGSGKSWQFPCGQWLAKDKGDGQIFRELFPRD